ncbi:hypothetical protein [Microbacterium sp. gxy059]|uniref:hypothetical protein n=1 Tax=Microbacterium sp. gxy059 TaxID=2957199 RepID=UPI003D98DA74
MDAGRIDSALAAGFAGFAIVAAWVLLRGSTPEAMVSGSVVLAISLACGTAWLVRRAARRGGADPPRER